MVGLGDGSNPCEFRLFPNMTEHLRERVFSDDENVTANVYICCG